MVESDQGRKRIFNVIGRVIRKLSPAGPGAGLSIFIFHRVLPQPDLLLPGEPDTRTFHDILDWIGRWFTVLPLSAAIEQLVRGILPAAAAAITFDDGYADNCTLAAPLLLEHRMHATFFVASGFLDGGCMWNDAVIEAVRCAQQSELDLTKLGLGRFAVDTILQKRAAAMRLLQQIKYLEPAARDDAVATVVDCSKATVPTDLMMSSQQLRSLHDSGMGIGAHTVSHPILRSLTGRDAREEMIAGRAQLEGIVGSRIGLFAYPNGKPGLDYDDSHVEMVRELGFDAAVSTRWASARCSDGIFQLPRFTPWDRAPFAFGLRMCRMLAQR